MWGDARWMVTADDPGSGMDLLHDLVSDIAPQRVDGVAGVDAERRGQNRSVGDVEAVHVPRAAARVHDVAAWVAAQRAASHGMAAGDLDALLRDERRGERCLDVLRDVQDQGTMAVVENPPRAGREHDARPGPQGVEPGGLVFFRQLVLESTGRDAAYGLVTEHQRQRHRLIKPLHEGLMAF